MENDSYLRSLYESSKQEQIEIQADKEAIRKNLYDEEMKELYNLKVTLLDKYYTHNDDMYKKHDKGYVWQLN